MIIFLFLLASFLSSFSWIACPSALIGFKTVARINADSLVMKTYIFSKAVRASVVEDCLQEEVTAVYLVVDLL